MGFLIGEEILAVLCFGSFASIIKKAIYKISDVDLIHLLFVAIDSSEYKRDKSDCNKWRKSELSLPSSLTAVANNITNASVLESYFETKVISKFASSHNDSMNILHALIKSVDTHIPAQTRDNILKVGRIDLLPSFLARAFLYAIQQNNVVANNSIDSIIPIPLLKAPTLTYSISPDGVSPKSFDDVFTEVQHNHSLGLLNPNCIRTYHLDVSNSSYIFGMLNDFLNDIIGQYVLTRLEIDGLIDSRKTHTIVDKAKTAFRKSIDPSKYGDGLSDILLYAFLEKVLGAPKLYNKIEFIKTQGGAVLGQGGIYLLPNPNDNKQFQFVVGKSNICGDITMAIDNAFNAIASTSSTQNEYDLLDSTILSKSFDQSTVEHLKKIVVPQRREKDIIVNDAYGIFLGYSLGLDPNISNKDFKNKACKKMVTDIQSKLDYIKQKITDANLLNYSFYFYLVPFNNGDTEKQEIMQTLINGGVF